MHAWKRTHRPAGPGRRALGDLLTAVGIALTAAGVGLATGPPVLRAFGTQSGVPLPYDIIDLGTLGGFSSVALAINENGQVVGSADTAEGLRHAYVWQDGVMTDLGTFANDPQSEAWDINNAGQVVGLSARPGARSVMWAAGGIIELGNPTFESSAHAINEAGQVVGWSEFQGNLGTRAFFWENGTMTNLGAIGGALGSTFSSAADINESGDVVGKATTGGLPGGAFLWNKSGMVNLGTLGGEGSDAWGINDSGAVVGKAQHTPGDKFFQAFVWEGGVMTNIGSPAGFASSQAEAINNLGQVVGGPSFLYETDGVMHDLHDLLPPASGWSDVRPRDINDQGQIVGDGIINGKRHAMLMNPLPPQLIPALSSIFAFFFWLSLVIAGALVVHRRTRTGSIPHGSNL